MGSITSILAAAVVTVALTAPASALTITNKDSKEHTIGVDMGDKEAVHKVPAGGTVSFKDECKDGCGFTGPWNHSWMAKTGADFSFDGKGIIGGRS